MTCPNPTCSGSRRVTHTYHVQGESAETRNLKCDCCGFRSTLISFLFDRPQEKKKGRGAVAVAKKIAKTGIDEFIKKIP